MWDLRVFPGLYSDTKRGQGPELKYRSSLKKEKGGCFHGCPMTTTGPEGRCCRSAVAFLPPSFFLLLASEGTILALERPEATYNPPACPLRCPFGLLWLDIKLKLE